MHEIAGLAFLASSMLAQPMLVEDRHQGYKYHGVRSESWGKRGVMVPTG